MARKGWHGESRRHAIAASRRKTHMIKPEDSIDTDPSRAKMKLYSKFGNRVTNIRFTPIRADRTRGVKFLVDGQPASYSYLTDIV